MMLSGEQHFKYETTLVQETGRKIRNGSFYLALNGQTYTTLRGLLNALRPFGYTSKQFYDAFYKRVDEGVCRRDNNFSTKFISLLDGYLDVCGKCPKCIEVRKQKMSESAKSPETISRKLEALKKANASRSKEERAIICDKQRKTLLKNYGPNYLSDRVKMQWLKLSKEEKDLIVKKANDTKLKNDSFTNGTHYKTTGKNIKLGNKVYCVQGFEDVVVKELFNSGIEFHLGKDVPRIPYPLSISGKSRPDIFLPTYNLLLEVKSDWTLSVGLDKCMEVGKNAVNLGFKFAIFAIKEIIKRPERKLVINDIHQLSKFINMLTSSQAKEKDPFLKAVQRLERDGSYRPIVFGSGSARVPMDKITLLEYDIVYSTLKDVAA